jgi:hypothetical protein
LDEVVWDVWGKAPDVSPKLGLLTVAHFLELKELADALLSQGDSRLTSSMSRGRT